MKIAIVSGEDVAEDWGDLAGEDCRQLCAALARHGHRVTCYLRRPDQCREEVFADDDSRIVAAGAGPVTAGSARKVLSSIGDWAGQLAGAWSSDPPDIVHAQGWIGGVAAQLAARRHGLPTVQTFHGLAALMSPDPAVGPPARTQRARLEPLLARTATWVSGGSSAETDALARLRRDRAHVRVLLTGVDVDHFTPTGPAVDRTEEHRVLCVEPNPLPASGFDKVIAVLPRLAGTELLIAETDPRNPRHSKCRDGLKKLAAELGVGERVAFLGAVAAGELPALLRSADVVACTPRHPSPPNTALQAMACGVAVVAESVGALADTVVDCVTGRVVAPNKPRELATTLKSFQGQSFQCHSMGAAGRSRAISRFSWDRIALDAQSIYHQACSHHALHRDTSAQVDNVV